MAKALEPHRPLFIEEPILVENPEALKQLAAMTTIPIALGERLYTRWDAKRFLEEGLIDILQPVRTLTPKPLSETQGTAKIAQLQANIVARDRRKAWRWKQGLETASCSHLQTIYPQSAYVSALRCPGCPILAIALGVRYTWVLTVSVRTSPMREVSARPRGWRSKQRPTYVQ